MSAPTDGGVRRIGVVDTMFARYDMGAAARDELANCPGHGTTSRSSRARCRGSRTSPSPRSVLIEREGCDVVVALGMPGSAPIDKQCAHEASQGIMLAQLLT